MNTNTMSSSSKDISAIVGTGQKIGFALQNFTGGISSLWTQRLRRGSGEQPPLLLAPQSVLFRRLRAAAVELQSPDKDLDRIAQQRLLFAGRAEQYDGQLQPDAVSENHQKVERHGWTG